jgi:hypothetical protein
MVINRFGVNLVDTVVAGGKIVVKGGRVVSASGSTAKEVKCH